MLSVCGVPDGRTIEIGIETDATTFTTSLTTLVLIHAILSRTAAYLVLAGSAAAFSPMMSMDMGQREIVRRRRRCF